MKVLNNKAIYILSIFLLFHIYTYSQDHQIRFNHIGIKDGLSQSSVYHMIQDKKGFIFMATNDGLNRYDGYDFKIYRNNQDDPSTISNNFIQIMLEDSIGNMWIGTRGGGLNLFDRDTEKFSNYTNKPNIETSLSSNDISSIFEDTMGNVWVGTVSGLNRFNKDSETFFRLSISSSDRDIVTLNYINTIFEDSSKKLWIGTRNGLLIYEQQSESYTYHFHEPQNVTSLSGKIVSSIIEDSHGIIWVATLDGGLNRYNNNQNDFLRLQHDPYEKNSLSDDRIGVIFEDNSNEFWIGTWNGLDNYDREKNRFTHYKNDPNDSSSLSYNRVDSIMEDRSGILWFGTSAGGLNRYNPRTKAFGLLQKKEGFSGSLSFSDVGSIYLDNDHLFVGYYGGGLDILNRNTGQMQNYKHDPNNRRSLNNNRVTSIFKDKRGNYWIGTWGGGLDLFNRTNGTFTHHELDENNPSSIKSNNIFEIYEDSKNILWVGTRGAGLAKFDRDKKIFTHFDHDPDNPKSYSGLRAYSIYEDENSDLWIGSYSGLNHFDRIKETFTTYQHDADNPESLSDNKIRSILKDSSGRLWIGTYNGLNLYDPLKKSFSHVHEKDGLPNSVIYGILEDSRGELWLSTNMGLSNFNPQTNVFNNYDVNSGLQSNEFNGGTYFKSPDGELFFGGIKGINAFYPQNIRKNIVAPPVVITDFLIFNSPVTVHKDSILSKVISETDTLTIDYKNKWLSFGFTALDFTAPTKNQYAYKMDGFDEDWIYVNSSRRFATYTNLDAGNYNFVVKASNNNGIWNETGHSINIKIIPPWWQTYWFLTFLILFILSSFFGIYKIRIRSINNLNKVLEKKVERRTSELSDSNELLSQAKEQAESANKAKSVFLANMSHELRTPLNAVLGFSEILFHKETDNKKKSYLDSIQTSGKSLLSLINNVLDISKIEAGKLELNYTAVSMQNLFKEMKSIFHHKIVVKGIEFKIEIDDNLGQSLLLDETKIRQVLINLIGNAIKFTDEGYIRIAYKASENKESNKSLVDLIIEIEDSGCGISESDKNKIFIAFEQVGKEISKSQGTGLGLAISQNIVTLLNGTIKLESEEGKGSLFTILIKDVEITVDQVSSMDTDNYYNPKSITFAPAKILITEDIEYNADILTAYLEGFNFELLYAKDGQEAIDISKKHLPSLILMDMKMPGVNGLDASKYLKEYSTTKHIPIIAVTASALIEEESLIRQYCESYLRKPINQFILIEELKKYLEHNIVIKSIPIENAELILPNKEELSVLYEIALNGDMDSIIKDLDHIESLNESYNIFCKKIRTWALGYNYKEIVDLLIEVMHD